MRLDFAPFWLQKDGVEPRQYEDAFAPASVDASRRDSFRCAVADGASESAYSRLWARQLVSSYANAKLTGTALAELPSLAGRWRDVVARALPQSEPVAWYLERKIEDGAFAAFVGLEFAADVASGDDSGTYRAVALGDSCFVQVREDRVRQSFPLERAEAFDARPTLLPSSPAPSDRFTEAIAHHVGGWQRGDAFYVMSDALACWFIASVERGSRPWADLDRFARSNRAEFRAWVQALRPALLKNDDVTLLRIRIL